MGDKQYKRLRIQLLLMWVSLIGILLYAILSHAFSSQQTILLPGKSGPQGLQGKVGLQGVEGPTGKTGSTGSTGAVGPSGSSITTFIQGPVGPQGEKGDPGDPAPVQEIRVNPTTGDLESKYSGDSYWEILVPCANLNTCPGAQNGSN